MHELSVIEGVLRNIDTLRATHGFTKVQQIEIACGRLNCLSEENLQFCLDALSDSPLVAGARIKVKRLADKYRCARCGEESFINNEGAGCQICGYEQVERLNNNGIFLNNLEVIDEN